MRSGEIWICNDNCCFGEERNSPHYAKILKLLDDVVEYCLIDMENGELMPMVTGMVDDNGDPILYHDHLSRKEFLYYYDKLRGQLPSPEGEGL